MPPDAGLCLYTLPFISAQSAPALLPRILAGPLPKERWAKPRQKRPFEDEERAVLACNTGRSATQNGTYRKTGCQRHACMGGKPAMKRRPATNPKWPWRPANRLCRLPSAAFFWRSNLADSGPDRILPHGKPTCRMARHWQKPLD